MTFPSPDDEAVRNPLVKVGPISGFPEFSPDKQAVVDGVIATIARHYTRAGAVSITTPLVERLDVLTAKGGGAINKEIYGLRRLGDSDDGSAADVGLKFDLTLPTARFVAQNESKLVFPLRRQQIDRVHRGERPKAGRSREFWQADFDIIGRGTLPVIADAEPPAIINGIFSELAIGPFVIRISNRKILSGYFRSLGIDPSLQTTALHIIDKTEGGLDAIFARLRERLGCSEETASAIVDFISMKIDVEQPLRNLELFRSIEGLRQGIDELTHVVATALALGVPEERLKIDLSVARGLDYYTGSVYETSLLDHKSIGSICSGGRYDDLASRFSTTPFPGVGISIGVTRLVTRLMEAGLLTTKEAFARHVLLARVDVSLDGKYFGLLSGMRSAGVPSELYLGDARLGDQLRYASRKGYGYAVIIRPDDAANGVVRVHDFNNGEDQVIPESKLLEVLLAA
ncbi:histidine--tRNA ligase [Bradyrhizobium sp. SZCCHNRI3042]|uniref:histidine--tRNA ligase n=1 Tax=Bradyrhizobium sp. SZCCHNRI3042 TaxID=3057291 RepID=UPI002916D73B|nr:histidine--tRNA ligase [Bradyrhizobium sp. SZCCHNRI3042]